jgi:uncharacterized LabA/DUF88 family protein
MNNFGLYIDADNVSHKQMNKIVSEFTPDMNFCIKKIFGDWSKTELKKWSKNVNEYGLEPIQCFRQNKKQSTDIYLITQMMNDIFFYPHIHNYILVSSDSDFIHLCQVLKKINKRLIIFGNKNSLLQNYCDKYIVLNDKKTDTKIKINKLKETLDIKKNEEFLQYFCDAFSDNYILTATKFKKKIKQKIKKDKIDFNNLNDYIDKFPDFFLRYQKNKRKNYVIYINDIKNEYVSRKKLIEDKSNFIISYQDVIQNIKFDDLVDLLF